MSAKVIWIHVGLVALFAGGAAAGILCYHRAVHPPGGHASQSVERFRQRLDLTDEQTAKVRAVLDGVHVEMGSLTREFHEKFKAIRSQACQDIRATLAEKQIPEFEKLVSELEEEHAPHRDIERRHTPH